MKSVFELDVEKGEKYWLGPIIGTHAIGPYQFIEFTEMDFCSASPTFGSPTGKNCFAAYINGASIRRSFDSLDAAIASAIAYKAEGPNSQAAHYFMKMIKENPTTPKGDDEK